MHKANKKGSKNGPHNHEQDCWVDSFPAKLQIVLQKVISEEAAYSFPKLSGAQATIPSFKDREANPVHKFEGCSQYVDEGWSQRFEPQQTCIQYTDDNFANV